jgi:hypothetical protein
MTDTELLNWLEQHAVGFGVVSDDNGHWAVVEDGMQSLPDGPDPQFISTSFLIEADQYRLPALTAVLDFYQQQLKMFEGKRVKAQ